MAKHDDIISDEMCISISQAETTSCTFIDIPGVDLAPSKHYERSLGLLSKYVRDPDTVVLCVVTASSRAKNSNALKMVREAKKLPQTILVLSQSDHIRSEQQTEDLIFSRLLHTSSDMQHLEGLAGCVAVAHCHQACHAVNTDHSAAERRLCSHMLHDTSTAYTAEGTQQQLREGMTMAQLILSLDSFYHQRVLEVWVPLARQKAEQIVPHLLCELEALGPKPELLTASHVVEAVCKLVDSTKLSEQLCGVPIMVEQGTQIVPLSAFEMPTAMVWGSAPWAAFLAAIEEKLRQAVQRFLDSDTTLQVVQSAFRAAFCAQSTLQLQRFESLQQLMLFQKLPELIADSKAATKATVDQALQMVLMQLYSATPPAHVLQQLDSAVRGCLIKYVLCALSMLSSLPPDFKLSEADEVHAKRALLNCQLMQTQALLDKLQHADETFTQAAMGPAWWETEQAQHGEPCDGSVTVADSPTHAAVWESVRRSLQRQQAEDEDLAVYRTIIVPVDPAGAHVSQSALAGPSSTVQASLPSDTLPNAVNAPVRLVSGAAEAEAEMETVSLVSEPAHWQHCSEAGSWHILNAEPPAQAYDADIMPFAT